MELGGDLRPLLGADALALRGPQVGQQPARVRPEHDRHAGQRDAEGGRRAGHGTQVALGRQDDQPRSRQEQAADHPEAGQPAAHQALERVRPRPARGPRRARRARPGLSRPRRSPRGS